MSTAPAEPLIGRIFDGKYRLDERLGGGGMGTVYRATHLLIDRAVAIKVLDTRFRDDATRLRFHREARAAGRLQHPNAVSVTDFGATEDGYVYIVMELLEGQTLQYVIARESPLERARAVSFMLQICAAVAAAHEAGIIHRDLKPGNIFITQRANVPAGIKVLDFGIAKIVADAIREEDRQTLTQVGSIIGTPRYMSPEQCEGKALTPASDVYSLGLMLYDMLTGVAPFVGSTSLAIAMKQASQPPRPPRELVGTIPAALEAIIMRALEKDPVRRPLDAGEFRRELLAVALELGLEHADITSAPTPVDLLHGKASASPSGRLVVDMARLRQARAAAKANAFGLTDLSASERRIATAYETKEAPPRLLIPIAAPPGGVRKRRRPTALAAVLSLVVVSTAGLVFVRYRNRFSPTTNVDQAVSAPGPAAANSTQEAQALPSPSPSPSPGQKNRQGRKQKSENHQSYFSSARTAVKKVRRFFKKRF